MGQHRQQQQRHDVGDLDHRVDSGASGVLVGIADRVAGHRGLMGLGTIATQMAVLDVLLGVVPGTAAGRLAGYRSVVRIDKCLYNRLLSHMHRVITGFDWDSGNSAKCLKHGLTREEIEAAFVLGPPDRAGRCAFSNRTKVHRDCAQHHGKADVHCFCLSDDWRRDAHKAGQRAIHA